MFECYLRYPLYSLWGYELDMARREIVTVTGIEPEVVDGGIRLASPHPLADDDLRRLTFFHSIVTRLGNDETVTFLTHQALIENTAKVGRKADTLDDALHAVETIGRPMNGRKESKYATHGVHDYKGKFYPQLVRSLITYLGGRAGDVVFDPFIGCGTTLAECYLSNMVGVGVDLNPLAHLIATAKTACLALPPSLVVSESDALLERIDTVEQSMTARLDGRDLADTAKSFAPLPYTEGECDYLLSWFPPRALLKLFLVLREIDRTSDARLRDLYRVLLSDIVIDCSQQDPRDLRIRRRKPSLEDAPVFQLFGDRLRETARLLVAFLGARDVCGVRDVPWECLRGDARDLRTLPSRYLSRDGAVDLIVTSPPYATALPYLDTDRLSLAFLRLANTRDVRRLDGEMIGNREIQASVRNRLEREFLDNYETCPLPSEVKACIRDVYERNAVADVGFRRKNMAALLYKYFDDMRLSIAEVSRVLRPGGRFAFVVGNNVTTAGGEDIQILTDLYLMQISEAAGLRRAESFLISVTTEDLAHSKNSIRTNTIAVMEKPR